ncbi:MAG: carboxypeptidase regulatory-like domain-containing protein [Propionibacteriales bacterium]|nr:carboxypeptidase regulatory-like domain-containing protein [Propionibacteriales bacterium]
MARTLRLVLALVLAVIGGLAITPPAHAVGTNTLVFHATDPDGAPLAITAWKYTGGNGGGNRSDTGDFTWNDVPDGDYFFGVSADTMDGTTVWYDGSPTGSTTKPATPTTLSGGQTLTMNFQFPRLATLSGTVTTSDGDPLANLSVAYNRLGMVRGTTTDSSGHYSFGYVRAGSITLFAAGSGQWVRPDPVQVTVPASGNLDHPFVLAKGASIDGTLTNSADSSPLAGITVAAYSMPSVSYVNSAKTDAAGQFHIDGLAGATYALHFDDPLGGPRYWWWSGDAGSPATATTKVVAASSQVTWNESITVPDPAGYPHSLAGTVTDTNGAPLAGIVMTGDDGATTVETTTDRNGRWALSTPDGSWTVRAEAGSTLQSLESVTPWYPQYYAGVGVADTAAQATVLPVSGNTTDGLNLTLSRSARVRLAVTAAASSDTVTPTWLPFTADGSALPSAPVDYQGNPLLRPGNYKLLIAGEAGGNPLLPRWYGAAGSFSASPMLTLAAGDDVSGSGVSLAPELAPTSAPTVSGSATVGSSLTATTGSWNLETGTNLTATWTRNGTPVATGATYRPVSADVGASLQYTVTATNSGFGHTFTHTTSTPVTVKYASKTSVKAKALGGKKVRFTITVRGTVRVSGTVTIRRGSVVVGTAKVVKGKATITVKRQPKGKKSYKATFNGSTQVAASTSATTKVKVR